MNNIEQARRDIEECFTPEEIAARWKCSKAAVCDLLRSGRLQGFKVGSLWRISPEDLQAYEQDPANRQPTRYRNSRQPRTVVMKVV